MEQISQRNFTMLIRLFSTFVELSVFKMNSTIFSDNAGQLCGKMQVMLSQVVSRLTPFGLRCRIGT